MKLTIDENEKRWRMINFKALEHQVEVTLECFKAENIEPILIKGWAASLKYPEKYLRWFSDIDLAVDPAQYDQASEMITRRNLIVDLHSGLRKHDVTDWNSLFANSQILKIGDTDVRILSEEDHLRVLCVHWLTDGGAYKEKLWDIFYAVENRCEGFSWDKCLNVVSAKRRLWILYTIGLAHRYLDLDISKLPFAGEISNLPAWLTETVEREWKSEIRLRPLHTCLNDRRELLGQIRKRIPPNPIQATIECEGDFDDKSRIKYQFKSVLIRLTPSIQRITKTLISNKK